MIRVLLFCIACEALTELFFKAAPVQPLRRMLIRITPFLYSKEQDTHLFECKYCVSLWIGLVLAFLYPYNIDLFIYALVFHRTSNYIHLLYSYLRDRQIDIRVERRKNANNI